MKKQWKDFLKEIKEQFEEQLDDTDEKALDIFIEEKYLIRIMKADYVDKNIRIQVDKYYSDRGQRFDTKNKNTIDKKLQELLIKRIGKNAKGQNHYYADITLENKSIGENLKKEILQTIEILKQIFKEYKID